MKLAGVDYGREKLCRVCNSHLFIVEQGAGTLNNKPISILTIRCYRCGTVEEQVQLDWSQPISDEDQLVVEDGVVR